MGAGDVTKSSHVINETPRISSMGCGTGGHGRAHGWDRVLGAKYLRPGESARLSLLLTGLVLGYHRVPSGHKRVFAFEITGNV